MNTIDLGKIGITLGGEWVSAATYEYLTMVTRHGISYVSKRTTTNEDPELVSAAWQPCSLRGESLYELMVRTGRFVGTLDEFLDEYEDTLEDAQDAADAANESNREFTEAEGLRVTAENGRVLAENNRVDQETYRETTFAGYNARIESIEGSEATRQSNENTRQLNEGTRQTNETARVNAEGTVEGQTGRAYAESQRVAAETARAAAEGSVQSQTGRAYAESLRVTAEQDRVDAENQRQIAEGNPDDAASATGSRWARYKYAESQRNDSYNIEEGSSSSVAGDGSRWGSYKTAEAQRSADIEMLKETKANIDGYYSTLTAGAAENLVGQTVDSEAYLIRPTGGDSNEVANGVTSILGMEGNSCAWNSLVVNNIPSGTESTYQTDLTIVSDGHTLTINGTAPTGGGFSKTVATFYQNSSHYYYYNTGTTDNRCSLLGRTIGGWISSIKSKYIVKPTSSGTQNLSIFLNSTYDNYKVTPILIDLTLLGIDNLTTTDQVEAWLAQHVVTKPYYAYNAGTILSAQTLGIKTYGQNLLNPTTKQAKLIPYEWEENSNIYTIKNVPSGATATFTPDATGVAETVDISGGSLDITSYGSGVLELSAATANTYVCMKWDEQKDDDVVPYEDHTYDFDVRKVYGKVNGEGEYVQCFPNGMRSAGSVRDEVTATKAIKRVEIVNMKNISWSYHAPYVFKTDIADKANAVSANSKDNILCVKYLTQTGNNVIQGAVGNSIGGSTANGRVFVYDSSYPTAADVVNFVNALSGVMLYYELATPITYTDLIYRDGGVDTPLADVLMNITVNNWSIEEQLLTGYNSGNPTSIPATINTQYGMDAVEQIDTLNKMCYFAKDVKDNLQALLNCVNTNCSETLGGTFSIGDPEEDSKVFTFTFTENTEPEP